MPGTKKESPLLKSIVPVTQNDFRHAMKHVGMSQSPTPATRNDIARRLKPPEVTTFAAVAIGTAIGSPQCPHRARTAGGCERKHKSNVERTQVHPQSPKIKQEPFATHLEKKVHQSPYISHQLLSAPPLHVFWHVSRRGGKSPQRPARLGHMGTLRSTLGCPL